MSLVVVSVLGVVGFLLLYLANSLKNEHGLLKIFIFTFIIFSFVLLGKAGLDSKETCSPVISQENVTGNITSFSYTTYCYTNNTSTNSLNTYRYLLLFIIFFAVYLIVFSTWYVFNFARRSFNNRR